MELPGRGLCTGGISMRFYGNGLTARQKIKSIYLRRYLYRLNVNGMLNTSLRSLALRGTGGEGRGDWKL